MSVFMGNRGRDGQVRAGIPSRRTEEHPKPMGIRSSRAEGVAQLLFAFVAVGATAALLSVALLRTDGTAPTPDERAPAVAHREATPAAPTESARVVQTAPAPTPEAAPPNDPLLAAQAAAAAGAPIPEPLAPPTADMREKLTAKAEAPPPMRATSVPGSGSLQPRQPAANANEAAAAEPIETTKAAAAPAPTKPADKKAEEAAKAADAGKMAKCFIKVSGRVQNNGACRIRHAGETVIFQYSGSTLEISHAQGRVWTAKVGGRSLGKVYKSGACWGGSGFYVCENG